MGAIFHNNELVEHEDWLTSVDKSKLVELFDDFHPSVKRVLEMATEVKQWPLLHRAAIPTWHKGRLVVIGDAAHPMLPRESPPSLSNLQANAKQSPNRSRPSRSASDRRRYCLGHRAFKLS